MFLTESCHVRAKKTDFVATKMPSWQFFVTFLGWLSDPFKWLSYLQIGDEKVTLNHLGFVTSPF